MDWWWKSEMHALTGRDEGSECDDVWACLLLDVYRGLGAGKARMSTLQADVSSAACAPAPRVDGRHVELQYLLGLINQSLYLKCAVSTSEHVEQFAASLALFRLHVELLHAHDEPSGLVNAHASVLDDQALAQNQVVALGELLVECDGGVRTRELASQLEFCQRCEHQRGGVKVRVGEL